MLKRAKLPSGFSGICLLLLISCSNNSNRSGASTKTYQPSLQLPAATRYYYSISNEVDTRTEISGKKIVSSNGSEIGLIYEVEKKAGDTLFLKITYDKIDIRLKSNDEEQFISAANGPSSADPVEQQLSGIKGRSVFVSLTSKGDIVKVSGTKEIADTIMAAMNAQNEYVKNTVRQQMSKLVGDEFIKNNLQQEFKLLPDTAVRVGDSWTQKVDKIGEIEADALTKFTLTDIDGELAEVEAVTNMKSNSVTSVMGSEVQANMEGWQKATYETNLQTGLLMSGKSTATLKGTIQVMGREVPLTVEISKKILTRKL